MHDVCTFVRDWVGPNNKNVTVDISFTNRNCDMRTGPEETKTALQCFHARELKNVFLSFQSMRAAFVVLFCLSNLAQCIVRNGLFICFSGLMKQTLKRHTMRGLLCYLFTFPRPRTVTLTVFDLGAAPLALESQLFAIFLRFSLARDFRQLLQ